MKRRNQELFFLCIIEKNVLQSPVNSGETHIQKILALKERGLSSSQTQQNFI